MIAQKINKWLKGVMAAAMTLTVATSCHDMWHQDYSDCPNGVYVKFKYDYNLQRADMFNDHVGQVTLYVFDENGNYITPTDRDEFCAIIASQRPKLYDARREPAAR